MSEPSVAAEPAVAVEADQPDETAAPEAPAGAHAAPEDKTDDWSDSTTTEVTEEDHQPVMQAPTEAGFPAAQPGSPVSILPEGAYIEYLES